jgi:hypothetical protein
MYSIDSLRYRAAVCLRRPIARRMLVRILPCAAILMASVVLLPLPSVALASSTSDSVPGTAQSTNPLSTPALSASPSSSIASPTALSPFASVFCRCSLSVDGLGTNNPAGGPIDVQKSAGATVRNAYLFAASTGESNYTPTNSDVTIDGNAVSWNTAETIRNNINSVNVESDVTSIVKPIVDGAPTGLVAFTVAEGANTALMDGEILAVIFNDPNVPANKTTVLMYGAQYTAGDTFSINLAKPIDLTTPGLSLTMGLGDSYSYQPAGQYSTVTVNGQLVSSSAGGQDDCDQKLQATPDFSTCHNGSLLTVGGIGDSTANPPNPSATDLTCSNPPAPRCDDELYNLLPFVHNGDTTISVTTQNPSNDDNIFFASLDLTPLSATVSGASHRYVALGDSVPYGHGLANPTKGTKNGLPPNQGPSTSAWPDYVDKNISGLDPLSYRPASCDLGGPSSTVYDQLAVSGAPTVPNTFTGKDDDCHYPRRTPVPTHKAVSPDELAAANLKQDPAALVSIQAGANDIDFAACLGSVLGEPTFLGTQQCATRDRHGNLHLSYRVISELQSLRAGLTTIINEVHSENPQAQVVVVNYYQAIPTATANLTGSDVICRDLRFAAKNSKFRTDARQIGDYVQGQLNGVIASVSAQYSFVKLVDISNLFAGHEMCTTNSWVFDNTWRAVHPTATGQTQIGMAVVAACRLTAHDCVGS